MRVKELSEAIENRRELLKKVPNIASILELGKIFKANGFEIRLVGGVVRDLLLGKTPKDVDLATTATPDQMIALARTNNLRYIETGLQHGTLTFVVDGEPYEITTLRVDKETDGRHATVEYTTDWHTDAERRDLTYNAFSLDLNGNLYDYFNGLKDLKNKTTRFVGDPNKRIQEDYIRILRYFRMSQKFLD